MQQHHHHQQQQTMMSSSAYYPNNVTTDHIQQYLDENKALILKIIESQNSGKTSECAENKARLQQNLMYLAAIADSQPQPPAFPSQYAASSVMQQPGSFYMQYPQAQQMPLHSSMIYNTQQHQQQQSVHNQLSMNSNFQMFHGNDSSSTRRYSEFERDGGGGGGGEGLIGSVASGNGDGREGQHSGGSHNSNGN